MENKPNFIINHNKPAYILLKSGVWQDKSTWCTAFYDDFYDVGFEFDPETEMWYKYSNEQS